jgi:hypothetical protein
LVECLLCKQDVRSSSLLISIEFIVNMSKDNNVFRNPFLIEQQQYSDHLWLKKDIQQRMSTLTNDRYRFYSTAWSSVSGDNSFLLNSSFSDYLERSATKLFTTPMKITKIWVNINPQGAYQQRHMHPEYDAAGTYYIFCPHNSGDITFYNPSPVVEVFNKLRPFYQFTYTHRPTEGDMLIWPGYLQHEVGYNYTNATRISISYCFNAINK